MSAETRSTSTSESPKKVMGLEKVIAFYGPTRNSNRRPLPEAAIGSIGGLGVGSSLKE